MSQLCKQGLNLPSEELPSSLSQDKGLFGGAEFECCLAMFQSMHMIARCDHDMQHI